MLPSLRAVMVLDRGVSFGLEGAVYSEIKATLYGRGNAAVYNIITGLGGRDVTY